MSGGNYERVEETSAVLALLDREWDEVVRASPHATVFQTASWLAGWIESVAAQEGATPLLITHRRQGRLIGALPLQLHGSGDKALLRPLSWPWADYHEALGDPLDEELVAALAEGLRGYLADHPRRMLLKDVVTGGLWERIGARLGARMSPSSEIASINLEDHALVESLLGRQEYQIKARRLSRHGPVRCEHFHRVADIRARFSTFVALHQRQWLSRDDAIAPFTIEVVERAYSTMVERMAPKEHIRLTEFLVGEQPIAMYFGFRFRDTYYGYRTTYDQDWFRYSPGHLMLQRMIRDFQRDGLRVLDLTRGGHAYKAEYSGGFAHNLAIELPASSSR